MDLLFGSLNEPTLSPVASILIIIIGIWTIFWKGVALWRSGRDGQKYWFVAFVILFPVNLLAIIELVYLFRFAKSRLTVNEVKGWISDVYKMGKKSKSK